MKPAFVAENAAAIGPGPSVGQQGRRQIIAEKLEAIAIELLSDPDEVQATVPTEGTLAALASKVYSARRQVDEIFAMPGLAVSPAWDMMLDLYTAKISGKRISVTSACIGGACPVTTGLRWLQALEGRHLIERKPDPEDRRRCVVELTEGGKFKVERALESHL